MISGDPCISLCVISTLICLQSASTIRSTTLAFHEDNNNNFGVVTLKNHYFFFLSGDNKTIKPGSQDYRGKKYVEQWLCMER